MSTDLGPRPPADRADDRRGLVDALSYLTLGHVFVANMTGNVVFLGFALAAVGEIYRWSRASWHSSGWGLR